MQFQLRMYVVLYKDVHFDVLCVFSCFCSKDMQNPLKMHVFQLKRTSLSTQRHEKPTENACRSIERRAKPAENQLKMHVDVPNQLERRVVL